MDFLWYIRTYENLEISMEMSVSSSFAISGSHHCRIPWLYRYAGICFNPKWKNVRFKSFGSLPEEPTKYWKLEQLILQLDSWKIDSKPTFPLRTMTSKFTLNDPWIEGQELQYSCRYQQWNFNFTNIPTGIDIPVYNKIYKFILNTIKLFSLPH